MVGRVVVQAVVGVVSPRTASMSSPMVQPAIREVLASLCQEERDVVRQICERRIAIEA